MKLTLVLLKESHRWRLRTLWRTKGVIKPPAITVPVYLKQKGIKVEDANEVVKCVEQQPVFERWEPSVKDDPRFSEQVHPDTQEIPIYEFDDKCRLTEGLHQASNLTKTQVFNGLPQSVKDCIGVTSVPNQDELVQRYIMQANVWDPTKEKLPKRYNPDLPHWHFKAETGIPKDKIRSITIRNLVKLCQMIGAQHTDLHNSRCVQKDHLLSTFYYFQGNKHVSIKNTLDTIVTSNQPLPAFATEDVIDASVNHKLPDLFPVVATIDLHKQFVWREENITGWLDGATHYFPHLLCGSVHPEWTTSERNALALMTCFGHCLALAKKRHGWGVKTLPEPISTQMFLTDGASFNFVCFQLNTLEMSSANGIKNLAWFDSDNALFNKIEPKRAMLRNTKYEDYDAEVFQKIVAMYVNGGNLGMDQKLQQSMSSS